MNYDGYRTNAEVVDDAIFDAAFIGIIISVVGGIAWSWWWLIGVAVIPIVTVLVLCVVWHRRDRNPEK